MRAAVRRDDWWDLIIWCWKRGSRHVASHGYRVVTVSPQFRATDFLFAFFPDCPICNCIHPGLLLIKKFKKRAVAFLQEIGAQRFFYYLFVGIFIRCVDSFVWCIVSASKRIAILTARQIKAEHQPARQSLWNRRDVDLFFCGFIANQHDEEQ